MAWKVPSLCSERFETKSSPYINRFLSPDSIIPDLSNPQSWNRYSYVTNRPVNFNDPTGHKDSCGDDGGGCSSNYTPPPDPDEGLSGDPGDAHDRHPNTAGNPDWWQSPKEHIYVEGYGYFDTGHLRRGWVSGNYLIGLNLEEDGRVFPMVSGKPGDPYPPYVVNYSVSENVTEDQLTGVLYGIYTDFEYSYELHQGTRSDRLSSFAPEDTQSDHIGFWAAINGKGIDEIPSVLASLGKVSRVPGPSLVVDSFGIPRNHEFLPMVPQTTRIGTSTVTQMINIPWPSWLTIDPIPSGPDTWQRK